MATIKDIAKKAGVSMTAVSNILNNKNTRFSRSTIEKVLKTALELGYEKNFQAYSLAKRSFTPQDISIGCIVSTGYQIYDDPFVAEVVNGIKKETNNSGIHLEYCVSVDKFNSPEEAKRILQIPVWGLIFIEVANKDIVNLFKDTVKNIVFISVSFSEVPGTLVFTDIESASKDAVKILINMGHKKIGFLGRTHILDENSLELRFKGYLRAFKECGLAAPNELIENVNFSIEHGEKGAAKLVGSNRPFTAIFCTSDDIAIGAIKVLKRKAIRIPEDVSIVGFDNSFLVTKCHPNLTSVHLYKNELGELAVKLLKENICSGYQFPSKLEIPWKIIIRGSIKALAR
jgi:Transcriptional regulators